MNLLFYASVQSRNTRKVFDVLPILEKEVGIEFYRSVGLLRQRLRQPANDLAAVVLFASSMKDVDELLAVRHYVGDIPLILILPESDDEFVKKGHLLRPRFLTFAEKGEREIGAALNKMLQAAQDTIIPDEERQ